MARPRQEKQVLTYRDPDYAKHDPFQNYGAGVITGASSGDEIRTPDGQRYIHAQGQWHNVHPPGGGSLPHGAYSIRWTLRPTTLRSTFTWTVTTSPRLHGRERSGKPSLNTSPRIAT